MKLDEFFQQRIFDPLGMIDTGFHVPPEKIDRLATFYHASDNGFQAVDGGPSSSWAKPKQFLSGGGGPGRGLISTATDYAHFAQMLLNKGELNGQRTLSRKTIELMTHSHLPIGVEMPFKKGLGLGFGLWIMEDVAQSFGMGTINSFGWDGGGWHAILGRSNRKNDWNHYGTIFWYPMVSARSVPNTGLSGYRRLGQHCSSRWRPAQHVPCIKDAIAPCTAAGCCFPY